MANSHTVIRRVAFAYLDSDDDWQVIGRISVTLSWSENDPFTIVLVLPTTSDSRWAMARELLLDGLACQYPGGVGDGCCYWVPWDDKMSCWNYSYLAVTTSHYAHDEVHWHHFRQQPSITNSVTCLC